MSDSPEFHVAALADDGAWVTPVRVRCAACSEYSAPLGGADRRDATGTPTGVVTLAELGAWAAAHECGPALAPGAWAEAGKAVQAFLGSHGADVELDHCVKAFARGLQACWDGLRGAAGES